MYYVNIINLYGLKYIVKSLRSYQRGYKIFKYISKTKVEKLHKQKIEIPRIIKNNQEIKKEISSYDREQSIEDGENQR